MALTSTKSKRFNPFSLDAFNFLLADVAAANIAESADASVAFGVVSSPVGTPHQTEETGRGEV